jgi:hypothetical protein
MNTHTDGRAVLFRRRFVLLLAILPVAAGTAAASDQKTIDELLKRQITGATLPLVEMQRYCEARVPRLKVPATAAAWEAEASRLRAEVLQKVVYRGEAARWRDAPARVEWLGTIPGGPGYRIKKLRYEALPGMWIPALLYEPEKLAGKVPVVMNVHGQPPGLLPGDRRLLLPRRQDVRRQGDSLRGRDQDPGATAGRSAGQERELQQPGFGAGQEPAPRARAAQGQALGPEVARSETCGARRDCQGQAVRRRADQVRQPVAASIFTC